MEIPFSRWYLAISARHSRRTYDPIKPIPPEILSSLQKVCDEFRPFPGARTIVITENAEQIYKFVFGSYGTIQGARVALAFIGDMNNRHMPEEIGNASAPSALSLEEAEKVQIKKVLQISKDYDEAARILGVDRKTLLNKRKKFGL